MWYIQSVILYKEHSEGKRENNLGAFNIKEEQKVLNGYDVVYSNR